jgi:low temperature requirement protein LtrA
MRNDVLRAPDPERVVSPIELFFDLVYVFAIAELPLIAADRGSTPV